MLPNLLIIGAAKCGTTSLHEYLALHPEIEMSRQKELHLFIEGDWRERLDWYAAQFPEGRRVRGESSPTYTFYPFFPSVPERVRDVAPDMRFIYLVRDPIERAVANYVEMYSLKLEHRPIDAALSDLDPANPHLCSSLYATQLERYFACFDPERILVIDSGDLRDRRDATLRKVFRFLDVDPEFTSEGFRREHNPRTVKVRYGDLGWWMAVRGVGTTRPGRKGHLIRPLKRLLSRPIERSISPATRELLTNEFANEVERLRSLTGLTLDWPSYPPPSASRAEAVGHR
ncbi:MAG: sulfotransferase family protein [Myxococcales bacterium]